MNPKGSGPVEAPEGGVVSEVGRTGEGREPNNDTTPTAGLRITRKKATKAGCRVWWRCDGCGSYGDASGREDFVLGAFDLFALNHDCGRA